MRNVGGGQMTLLAKAGEQVTCENKHPIATVAQDIKQGDIVSPKQFRDWQWPYQPKSGEPVACCPVCDGQFIKVGHRGSVICIDGNWRGLEPYEG